MEKLKPRKYEKVQAIIDAEFIAKPGSNFDEQYS